MRCNLNKNIFNILLQDMDVKLYFHGNIIYICVIVIMEQYTVIVCDRKINTCIRFNLYTITRSDIVTLCKIVYLYVK